VDQLIFSSVLEAMRIDDDHSMEVRKDDAEIDHRGLFEGTTRDLSLFRFTPSRIAATTGDQKVTMFGDKNVGKLRGSGISL